MASSGETVEVEIDVDGSIQVSVKGVKGASCKDITKQLESALGNVTESKVTREFSEKAQNVRTVNQ